MAMSNKFRSYAELREQIRVLLPIRNPEWIEANGGSPLCDSYEVGLAELLRLAVRGKTRAAGM